jgi:hypothetical protein
LQGQLYKRSEEFRAVWNEHEIGIGFNPSKRFVHPAVGDLDLACQALLDPEQSHALLVYTAVPGTESHEKLRLLAVIGTQDILTGTSPPL